MENASPLLAVLAFRAWQLRRYWQALWWVTLTAAVREDMGVVYGIPLALLVGVQYMQLRVTDSDMAQETLRWGVALVVWSVVAAVLLYIVPRQFINVMDLFHYLYYDKLHPFGHLTGTLLRDRLYHICNVHRGVWLPVVVLALAGAIYRDMRLVVGAIGLMPYIVAMFLATFDMFGRLDSYKSLQMGLVMLWPALMALDQPKTLWKRYVLIQCIVLACGLSYITWGSYYDFKGRWILQPFAHHSAAYRDFGKHLDVEKAGETRASHGVLALYPYQFPVSWQSSVLSIPPGMADKVDTVIWFAGDRDQNETDKVLARGNFVTSVVPGTKVHISHKVPKEVMSPIRVPIDGELEPYASVSRIVDDMYYSGVLYRSVITNLQALTPNYCIRAYWYYKEKHNENRARKAAGCDLKEARR